VYTLQFRFDAQYPISSPAVQFVITDGKQSPIHPVSCYHYYLPILLIIHLACIFKWARKSLSCDNCSSTFMIDILMQICASILGNEWSPVLSVVAVCVTLQSMLASCKVRCCCPSDWPPPLFTDHIYRLSRRKNGWCLRSYSVTYEAHLCRIT
jgi:ubiquitin-conjugating enzyme E2 W